MGSRNQGNEAKSETWKSVGSNSRMGGRKQEQGKLVLVLVRLGRYLTVELKMQGADRSGRGKERMILCSN